MKTPYPNAPSPLRPLWRLALLCTLGVLCQMCSPTLPDNATDAGRNAQIYPDYSDITIPANIAPLNFDILEPGDEYTTHVYTRGTDGIVLGGQKVRFDGDAWHTMLETARGDTVYADIYVRANDGWSKFNTLKWEVAEDIDPYISYRLIEPSFVNYETMRISQRSLTDFTETEIINNRPCADGAEGQCMNCHSYQDYNRGGAMQMHIRSKNGGTLIIRNGSVRKVALKDPSTISAGVYPAWHPTLPLIAYSTNITRQAFHNCDPNKIEVYDNASDLILYDVDADRITSVSSDTAQLESFPAWSPDGRRLYYVSAPVPGGRSGESVAGSYRDIRYDILSRGFDPATRTFSAVDTVYRASEAGMSAALPRISPDGRYLLFSAAPYGTFHIWHHDADLWLMDLASGHVRRLDEVNSPDTESYHSFSSNGRWILFSSRRDDGSYTRLYIAYFDKHGRARKAFMLPQADPASNGRLFKSYNVPEFMARPVQVGRKDLIRALAAPAQ